MATTLASNTGNVAYSGTGASGFYAYSEIIQTGTTSTGISYQINYYGYVSLGNFQSSHFSATWTSSTATVTTGKFLATSVTGTCAYGQTIYASGSCYYSPASGTKRSTTACQYTVPYSTFTISYDANGGSGSVDSQTKSAGKSITLASSGYTYSGYALDHWNTAADDSGTSYNLGATYSADASATLYAIWRSLVPSITVDAYRVSDSSGSTKSVAGTYVRLDVTFYYSDSPTTTDLFCFDWKFTWDSDWNNNVAHANKVVGQTSYTLSYVKDDIPTSTAYTFMVRGWDNTYQAYTDIIYANVPSAEYALRIRHANKDISTGSYNLVVPNIYVNWHSGPIGATENSDATSGDTWTATTLTKSTWTVVDKISLSAGTYMVTYGSQFSAGSGMARVALTTSNTDTPSTSRITPTAILNSAVGVDTNISRPIVVSETTMHYLWAYSNGTSITSYPYIFVVRIA